MIPEAHALLQVLRHNPHLISARLVEHGEGHALELRHLPGGNPHAINIPTRLRPLPIVYVPAQHIRPLILVPTRLVPQNRHQECHNEPVPLGVQIQPGGANWVGTAGAPISWTSDAGSRRFGILSNWHVMANEHEIADHPQHQPNTFDPPIARLAAWHGPHIADTNFIDVALADAELDGYHTIAKEILGIGPIRCQPEDATPGRQACKAGRTTKVTFAPCESVGAAVRVNYGTFDAVFADQDIYVDGNHPFSAPGDSGSLILACDSKCPLSLLFAGGGGLTVGNPIRYLQTAYNLEWLW